MKFENSQELLEFFQNIMKDTFEKETGGEVIIDFSTVEGKFLTAILNALALYGYGQQTNIENSTKQQFVSLCNSTYLKVHGNEQNLAQNAATSSEGYVVVEGEVGASVPAGIEFYKDSNNYVSQDSLKYITEVSLQYNSIIEQQGKIIVKLTQDYELASGLTMKSISGGYTGENIKIETISTDSFTFDKIQGQQITGQTGTVVFNIATVFVNSKQTGESTNAKNGDKLTLTNQTAHINDTAFVSYSGLSGGINEQSETDFRNTLLYIKQNIPQGWTSAKIDYIIRTYGNGRYFNDLIYTPRTQTVEGKKTVGYTTTYVLKKSLDFFSATEKNVLRDYFLNNNIYEIKDDNNYFNIVDPVKKVINIKVQRTGTKQTLDMADAIKNSLTKEFQFNKNYCWFAKSLNVEDIKDCLRNTVDSNGIVLGTDYRLVSPTVNVSLAYNEFPIIEVEVI